MFVSGLLKINFILLESIISKELREIYQESLLGTVTPILTNISDLTFKVKLGKEVAGKIISVLLKRVGLTRFSYLAEISVRKECASTYSFGSSSALYMQVSLCCL